MTTLPIQIHDVFNLQKEYSKKLKEYTEAKKNYEKEYTEIKLNFDKTKHESINSVPINELQDAVNLLNVSFSEIWNMLDELDELREKIRIIMFELQN
jgi:hypothetical protein